MKFSVPPTKDELSAFHHHIEALLPRVSRPTRYLGNEMNAVKKDPADADVHVAMVFPESYEIGMSWPGQQILYSLLNSHAGVYAERCYALWPDMEAVLKDEQLPPFSLETWTPLQAFDIVGITLQHELVYTNVLTMLERANIPFLSTDRTDEHPLILAGGPVAYHCEAFAPYLDAVALGDGEDVFLEICDVYKAWKGTGQPRQALLEALARVEGVYVPSFYDETYEDAPVEGWTMPALKAVTPNNANAPAQVRRRFVEDLNRVPFPEKPVVALGKVVHSRLGIEIQRGCTRACRFCQAGYIYRPERQRDPAKVKELVAKSLKNTGYDEVSLLSLSVGDYGCLDELLGDLIDDGNRGSINVSVSLPSIRADTMQESVVDKVETARRSGFTMAPEAGSARLRDVINKALSMEQIARAAEIVFSRGWKHIKFYYIIGLPTETDEDIMEIVETARMCQEIGRKYTHKADIIVSTSTFTPKPFTPFQWAPQIPREEILRKQQLLKRELGKTRLSYRWHDAKESFLEAAFSRGDRRLAPVIRTAWEKGARFDGWQEHFNEEVWLEAFKEHGVDPAFFSHRAMAIDETLSWDHIDCGVKKDWLQRDFKYAVKEKFIPDCATGRCYDCGVCDWEVVKNRTYVSERRLYYPQGMKPKGKGEFPYIVDVSDGPKLRELLPEAPRVDRKDHITLRVRMSKVGRSAYLSQLDVKDNMFRALKRAGVRVAYSEGHRPKPRIAWGPALMTGAESLSEHFDMRVMPPFNADGVIARINEGLPDGLNLESIWQLSKHPKKVAEHITGTRWLVTEKLPSAMLPYEERKAAVEAFMAKDVCIVKAYRKPVNVRPHVMSLEATESGFAMDISFSNAEGSARAIDVMQAVYGEESPMRVLGLGLLKVDTFFVDRAELEHGIAADAIHVVRDRKAEPVRLEVVG